MKKIFAGMFVAAFLAALVACQKDAIVLRILEKGIESRLGEDIVDTFEDGLHITLCGAGGPMPAPNASGPCVAVVAGKNLYLVDAGTDGLRNLARMGFQPGNIKAVFLTHFHSDHIDGLGEVATIRWAGGDNTSPLPVYGPEGLNKVVDGFNLAYSHDFVYRHDHHGDTVAPMSGAGMVARSFTKPPMGEARLVFQEGDFRVEALTVDHAPVEPAVGYRFSYKGRTALITGDTDYSENIVKLAEGVDLLVHEALAPNLVNMMNAAAKKNGNAIMAKVTFDILDYHASPVEAAETARDAGVGHLLYYHIVPPLIIPGQKSLYLDGAEDIFPNYTIGEDGVSFSLPANSTKIKESKLSL